MSDAALIKLRLSEPDLPRPYRIPTGVPGLCLLFFPPAALSISLACLAQTATVIATVGVLAVGVTVYFVLQRWVWMPGGAIQSGALRRAVSSCPVGVNTGTTLEEHLSQSSDDDEGAGLMQKQPRSAGGRHHASGVNAELP